MQYFILKQDPRVNGPKVPANIAYSPLKRIFSIEEAMAFPVHNKTDWEYPAVIERPIYLVDSAVKAVLSRYNKKMVWNAVMLNDLEKAEQHIYWLMGVPFVSCVSKQSTFHADKSIKNLVLDESEINHRSIFKVDGLLEQYLVVSLNVAESLLRREIYGIELTAVQTDRGE